MRVIEGSNVDLIQPFPLAEVNRVINWSHCYRSMVVVDGSPGSTGGEELAHYGSMVVLNCPSYGVIDRNGVLGYHHEAPLVGIFWLEPGSTPANTYIHFTSSRKSFGSGLMLEAAKQLVPQIFADFPTLTRISAGVLQKNSPARNFLKAIGFKQDGLFKDFVTQNGVPLKIAHFGYLRSYLDGMLQQHDDSATAESQQ